METLIKRLWPLLKAPLTARLAHYLQLLAARFRATLGEDDALALAVFLVTEIEDLLTNDDPEVTALVAKAAAALAATP